MPEGFFDPLPKAGSKLPVRRGKFIDVEIYGNVNAATGTLGDLTVSGTMTIGVGGVIQTATSGNRIALTEEDQDRIRLYTGDDFEAISGVIRADAGGTDGTTRQLATRVYAPTTTGDVSAMYMSILSESEDDISIPPQVIFAYAGGSAQTPELKLQNSMIILQEDGSASAPSLTYNSDTDTGMYRNGTNELSIAAGGSEVVRIGSFGLRGDDTGDVYNWDAFRGNNGSASAPTFSFDDDSNTGMYLFGSDHLGFAIGGSAAMSLQAITNGKRIVLYGGAGCYIDATRVSTTDTIAITANDVIEFYQSTNRIFSVQGNALDIDTDRKITLYGGSTGIIEYRNNPTARSGNTAVWYSTGGTYHLARTSSSKEYKANIQDAQKTLEDIDLSPVSYEWNEEPNREWFGLLAESVVAQDERLGIWNEEEGRFDDYDTRGVIAVLVAKINRLEQQMEAHNCG